MNLNLLLSRSSLGVIAILLVLLAIRNRERVDRIVNNFFTESTHPLNLAIFRITVFLTLIKFVDISSTVWFSQMPEQLQFLPGNLGWLFNYLPIDASTARLTSSLMLVFCFTGAIGLFSRTSAFVTTILGFYVLGIPQLWGKVNHYNHLLWFVAILAVSRCGDFLSVDAIFAAWKRADAGTTQPPQPARLYTLPLRFVWLLMGVIYFFPGFWKVWNSGYRWAWSDNLNFQMYRKWLELDGWVPIFRIDQYPLLNRTSGLWTIAWELSFILLIFLPRWRLPAALMGLFFHNMTNLFMRISFWTLQVCYVSFFNWHKIFNSIGRFFFSQPMYVVYDGNCKLCRRTIASLRRFDILGQITYVNALNGEELQACDLLWIDPEALLEDMHTVVGKQYWRGFSAYRVLSRRIPVFWLILPLLYVWPIPRLGNFIYHKVADSRTCDIAKVPTPDKGTLRETGRSNTKGIIAVGILFLFLNTFYSIKYETAAWPFSCYPTFSWIQKPQEKLLEVIPLDASGEPISLATSERSIKQYLSPPRVDSLVKKLLKTNELAEKERRLQAFWQLLAQNDARLNQAVSVDFYEVRLQLDPERQDENPISQELAYRLKLQR
ncbi:hypothetical protein C1752_01217 [Acaryochloris thomasi RCC1774]|uniref:HTTM-like domain-containing protein n=1 Tax=Acaryochloris thomasi RCC1774 TaxID=1764569 RepID=A0A2W1JWR7_9CYAN|nr:DCC1-like thiol-disulfide oxidoreductase family protein [Acaryochloris thomasi]PZD74104.1 hypothetical protein C1752_01217 [Acaryochloris thomasi RCC1774]